jgi:hypothetical protein
MATHSSGWQQLAETIADIDEMKKEIEDIEKTLEAIR